MPLTIRARAARAPAVRCGEKPAIGEPGACAEGLSCTVHAGSVSCAPPCDLYAGSDCDDVASAFYCDDDPPLVECVIRFPACLKDCEADCVPIPCEADSDCTTNTCTDGFCRRCNNPAGCF